jgi:UDP-N-acetylglucosamine--N-acetylmuramyl-(pentapeptide) pyrophosphoryl-undecaprenol N-acetylglucosamine transferase
MRSHGCGRAALGAVMPHLVVMAAGTGGHIMPGLAVAREMQRRGWSVSWLGTAHGMENRLVPPALGIAAGHHRLHGLRGKGLLHTPPAVCACSRPSGIAAHPAPPRRHAVLGMGGYVCFPGGLMASLLGKPLMLVNADAALLLSNKALLPVADRVAFGFDGPARRTEAGVVTGNPVRAEIETCQSRPSARRPQRPAEAAGGGRQPGRAGAERDAAAGAGADRPGSAQVVHQTGEKPATLRARPTPRCRRAGRGPSCCPSSTTCRPGWPTAT